MNDRNGFARIPTAFIILAAVAASGGAYYAVRESQPLISNNIPVAGTNRNEQVGAGACREIINATFSSVAEYGCGMVPAGSSPTKCHYELKFSAQSFEWGHDDTIEQGPYTCNDGAISATSHYPERIVPGQYNPDTKILKWGDSEYRNLAENETMGEQSYRNGQYTKDSCNTASDCVLWMCAGPLNKEWAKEKTKEGVPDLPCATYYPIESYALRCTANHCTAVKK